MALLELLVHYSAHVGTASDSNLSFLLHAPLRCCTIALECALVHARENVHAFDMTSAHTHTRKHGMAHAYTLALAK